MVLLPAPFTPPIGSLYVVTRNASDETAPYLFFAMLAGLLVGWVITRWL